jgi:hypothetical protein
MHGVLLCGSNGNLADPNSLAPEYVRVYDASIDTQYCVPTDDMRRALSLPFEEIQAELRAASADLTASRTVHRASRLQSPSNPFSIAAIVVIPKLSDQHPSGLQCSGTMRNASIIA